VRERTPMPGGEDHNARRKVTSMSTRRRLYVALAFTLESLLVSGGAARIPEPQGTAIIKTACCTGRSLARATEPGATTLAS
jgi:hypothetical protein